ncbi:MAG: TolC family protein [Nitrosomonadales bacterium]|nr:TolC family protein [Nitrosomonadales bacterium]
MALMLSISSVGIVQAEYLSSAEQLALTEREAVGSAQSASGIEGALPVSAGETNIWTFAKSIRRALDTAPELRAAEADVAARAAELTQAEAWPNPSIDLDANDRLGQEDGRGGYGFTRVGLSQPLPLRRIAPQRAAAEANLESAHANLRYRHLLLEREAARVFHALQLAAARRQLAEERQRLVAESLTISRKSAADRLVRYLTPLERQRLSILNEEASQAVAVAEREQQKALIDFRTLLALPSLIRAEPAALTLPDAPASLAALTRELDSHPALLAARKEAEAADAGIAVAESQRYADPTLNLYRERDYLAGARRDVTGVGISVQIPLWNTGSGTVARAGAEAGRVQAQLALVQRDARSNLEQAHTQLLRLLDQTGRLRANLLEPARAMFALTRRSFAAGELNVLTLVDANNTYFDALARYLELQQECALAAADLRLASGVSLLDSAKEQTR